MSSGQLATTRSVRRGTAFVAVGLAVSIIVAVALDVAVAAIAHAAGASGDFSPLKPPAYASLTAIGILAGAAGWAVIRGRSASLGRLLRGLVPVVLLASLVPDILVGASAKMPGASWGAVAALMSMHLIVTAVAVTTYLLVLPVPSGRR
jgi:hypothetical protein